MANNFSKADERFYEGLYEFFESEPSVVNKCPRYTEDGARAARGNYTFWRPQQQLARVVTGLDLSSENEDVDELMYPATLTTDDIRNHKFTMDAVELNDEFRKNQKIRAVGGAILGHLDTQVMTEISNRGTMVERVIGAATNYDQLAGAEVLMGERGIPLSSERCMALGHRAYKNVAGDLSKSNGQFNSSTAEGAYRSSQVPPIAGFDTFRAQYSPALAAQTATGVTVTGAQKHVPAPNLGTGLLQDNRSMTLTVSATAGLVAGDAFTIAGVNSVDMIRKTDTGQLNTFRVISVDSGTTMTISPAIIVDNPANTDAENVYANCTAEAANGAAITFLNDDAASNPIPFWATNAVEILHAPLNTESLNDSMGVMQSNLSSGLTLYMFKQSNIDTLKTIYRCSLWAKGTVNCPEAAGVVIDGQA